MRETIEIMQGIWSNELSLPGVASTERESHDTHSAGRRRPWMSWTAPDMSRLSDNDNRQAKI
jgi:hypothetical protein